MDLPLPIAYTDSYVVRIATRFGGGNAFSGNTGNDRGGNFNNVAEDDEDIANIPGGTAGTGGQSFSGDAIGGDADDVVFD